MEKRELSQQAVTYLETLDDSLDDEDSFYGPIWLPIQYRHGLPDSGFYVIPSRYYYQQWKYLESIFSGYESFEEPSSPDENTVFLDYGLWKNLPGVAKVDLDFVVMHSYSRSHKINISTAYIGDYQEDIWLNRLTFSQTTEGIVTAFFLAERFWRNLEVEGPPIPVDRYLFDKSEDLSDTKNQRSAFYPDGFELPKEYKVDFSYRLYYGMRIHLVNGSITARLLACIKPGIFMDVVVILKEGIIQKLRRVELF